LNGLENVTVATGDLYDPAESRRFDRIVAHPPYVPVLRPKWIYHDGGQDGEQIIRRAVEGVSDHLEPGGLFYLLAMASDRADAPYERRVRQWLGENETEFDIAVFAVRSLDPEEFAVRAVVNSENASSDVREFKRLFRSLGVQDMIYAVLLIQRRMEDRPVFTIRRQNGPGTTVDHIMATLQWETSITRSEGLDSLMSSPLRANRDAEMRVRHQLTDEGWQVAEYMLRTTYPFSMDSRTDPWAPYLMAQCDGSKTTAEYFEDLKAQEVIPSDAAPEEFARALAVLISGGFLLIGQ